MSHFLFFFFNLVTATKIMKCRLVMEDRRINGLMIYDWIDGDISANYSGNNHLRPPFVTCLLWPQHIRPRRHSLWCLHVEALRQPTLYFSQTPSWVTVTARAMPRWAGTRASLYPAPKYWATTPGEQGRAWSRIPSVPARVHLWYSY